MTQITHRTKSRFMAILSTPQAAYDFLFQSTADGIIIADRLGIIKDVNPAAASMLGVTVEGVKNKHPRTAFAKNATLINLFTRSGDHVLDVRLPRRRLAIGVATTLDNNQRMVILQDVTEKRNLETRRESLSKALTHDLQNPITAVRGFVELVQKFGDLNPQQERFITRAQQTTTKLYEMVETLVDLAWVEAGMPLEHRPIQLRNLINRAVEKLTPMARQRQVIIAVSVQNPMPTVMGDLKRLEFVINALLHNAILYSYPEQTVAIHGWGDDEEVYCSVADRGVGISDDEIELIFDRMYRSRDLEVQEKAGGGLGLTMAKTIVKRHGGDIWATSNLGEGSTFTFVLPKVET